MKIINLLIFALISIQGFAQYPSLLIEGTDSISVHKIELSSRDNKRCVIFNLLFNQNEFELNGKKAGLLIAVKIFFDSSEYDNLFCKKMADFEGFQKNTVSLKEYLCKTTTLFNANAQSLFETDIANNFKSCQPDIEINEFYFKENGICYRVEHDLIYLSTFLLVDFQADSISGSHLNIINTKSTVSNDIRPGKMFLLGTKEDSLFHFVRVPTVFDDDYFKNRIDKFDYKPGIGLMSLWTFVGGEEQVPQNRMDDTNFKFKKSLNKKSTIKIPWKKDEYYYFGVGFTKHRLGKI